MSNVADRTIVIDFSFPQQVSTSDPPTMYFTENTAALQLRNENWLKGHDGW